MRSRAGSCARGLFVGLAALATAAAQGQSLPTSAIIDAVPLELTMPERFQVITTLEPIRRVSIVAPADGMVRSLDAGLGATVRDAQQIAEIDRAEASARLRVAQAELRESQARLAAQAVPEIVGKAQLEAAEARVELARIDLERLTLRAPFSGRIVATPVAAGQYVLKGTVIAELADVSALKALTTIDRRAAKVGGELPVQVEDQDLSARIQSIGPLPATEEYKMLRLMAAPFASAWIQIANAAGELEPGYRVRSSSVPDSAVAVIPKGAVKTGPAGPDSSQVQVIRNEYVVNLPIRILGKFGPDRLQVAGAFLASDALIASSSSPLLAGTLIRFGDAAHGIEGTTPDPARSGRNAALAAPGGAPSVPRARNNAAPASRTPARRPSPAPAQRQESAAPF